MQEKYRPTIALPSKVEVEVHTGDKNQQQQTNKIDGASWGWPYKAQDKKPKIDANRSAVFHNGFKKKEAKTQPKSFAYVRTSKF